MRKYHFFWLVVVALVVFVSVVSADPGDSRNFVATLSGANEVPARETLARGNAVFQVAPDGMSMRYRLIVANIENVAAAHIHCGVEGANGPVGVTLYVGSAASGRADGVIATGVITAPDPGNACGWVTLDDVLAAMLDGSAYVNVHTNDGVAPTNTGPGDFASGEIRGQVREAGPTK